MSQVGPYPRDISLCYATHPEEMACWNPEGEGWEITGMEIEALTPLEVWEPRCRSEYLDNGSFLICTRCGIDVIALIPPNYASDPWQVYERLLNDQHSISYPSAGGFFSADAFNFAIVPSELERVPEFFLRIFASPQIGPEHWFNRYRPARILIRSKPSAWGTIDDVLELPAIPLNAG